jgi:hypothetical protein
MRRRKRRLASAGSIAMRTECLSWFASLAVGQIAQCFYDFFMIVAVIRYKTKATARRALPFIVRIFVNDTIAIAVWTSFHVCVPAQRWVRIPPSPPQSIDIVGLFHVFRILPILRPILKEGLDLVGNGAAAH